MFNEFARHTEPLMHLKWQEARYLDLWSIVHLISGVILYILLSFFGFSFWGGVLTAFLLMVVWEFFESAIGLGEHATNLFSDLVIGLIGYFGAIVWLPASWYVPALIVLLSTVAVLDWIGFNSYKKRVRA